MSYIPNIRDAEEFINIFRKTTSFLKDEFIHLFELGLDDYYETQIEKFLYLNTFFHQEIKVNFFDTYFKLDVYQRDSKKQKINFDKPINNLKDKKYSVIIGTAGSGKSMMTKYIFFQSILENRKIPILIELRNFDEQKQNFNFEKYIFSQLLSKNVKPNLSTLKSTFKSGLFLIILDGYDEVYSKNIQHLNKEIEDFIDKYKNNHFIITSRPGAGAERLYRFEPLYIEPLNKLKVVEFVNLVIKNIERRERVLAIIRSPRSIEYSYYLSNPLLLSMFLMTCSKYPSLPKKKTEFYYNVFDTLYSKHDGITKHSFDREKRSGADKNAFEKIIANIAYQFFINGKYDFSETELNSVLRNIRIKDNSLQFDDELMKFDLITAISLITADGLSYSFPHRSLQEFFTSVFIHKVVKTEYQQEKIYSYFINKLIPLSNDSFFNFYEICNEIDSNSFKKTFVIKYLQKINKEVKGKNKKNNLLFLLKMFHVKILLTRNRKQKIPKEDVYMFFPDKLDYKKKSKNILFYTKIKMEESSKYYTFFQYLKVQGKIDWFIKFLNSKDFKLDLAYEISKLYTMNQFFYKKKFFELDYRNKKYIEIVLKVFTKHKFDNKLENPLNFINLKIENLMYEINLNTQINDTLCEPISF